MHQASAFKLNFIVNDVQNATYSSHGAPCSARDLFPWLNTRVKVHISVWTIRKYPKRHSSYLSDSGDTFLPLKFHEIWWTISRWKEKKIVYQPIFKVHGVQQKRIVISPKNFFDKRHGQ